MQSDRPAHDLPPFFVSGPDQIDVLLWLVAIALVGVVLAFGALYFTVNALPDRMTKGGATKAQIQIVSILGLLSLVTMNNLYWVAALLLAAMPIPDFITPLRQIATGLKTSSTRTASPQAPDDPEPANRDRSEHVDDGAADA